MIDNGPVPKTCLDCGKPISKRNRCRYHQKVWEQNRPNRSKYRDPEYIAYVKDSYCMYCGATENLTKDHMYPGLQTLCLSCNDTKGSPFKEINKG